MSGLIKGIKAAFGDVEMTPYTVVAMRGEYEERLYPARRWACTTMKATEQSVSVSPMFRALFNYISGKNVPNIRIDMTSPVTTYIEPGPGPTCESSFTMGFLIPEEYQDNPPTPPDKSIFIEDRPELRVLTRRFGGYATDEIIINEAKSLAEAIQKNDEKGVNFDTYYTAGYDPPFKLFGRRNEVWFVKTVDPAEDGGSVGADTVEGQVQGHEVHTEANGVNEGVMSNEVNQGEVNEKMNGDVVQKEMNGDVVQKEMNGDMVQKEMNGDIMHKDMNGDVLNKEGEE